MSSFLSAGDNLRGRRKHMDVTFGHLLTTETGLPPFERSGNSEEEVLKAGNKADFRPTSPQVNVWIMSFYQGNPRITGC